MKKRKKAQAAVDAEAPIPVLEEATNPTIAPPDFGESEDTAVTEAPADVMRDAVRPDEWDGPTTEAAATEMAALVAASAEAGGEPEASGAPDGGVDAELPVAAEPGRLESVLESLLFASDRPLPINDLKRLTGERTGAKLTAALEALRERRQQEGAGVQIIEVAGGWHMRTNPENVAWVSRLVAGRPQRLTRAMLETLSIVAYRQPITRPEIDDVRGVDCGPVLKTLLDRGLVRMIGKKEEAGRPILYGTTPEFLRIFSLKDLAELPTLREFHELGADDMAKVDATAPLPGEAVEAKADGGKPAPTAPRELDPEEDDELLTELDRAAAKAAKAAEVAEPTAPDAQAPAQDEVATAPPATTE